MFNANIPIFILYTQILRVPKHGTRCSLLRLPVCLFFSLSLLFSSLIPFIYNHRFVCVSIVAFFLWRSQTIHRWSAHSHTCGKARIHHNRREKGIFGSHNRQGRISNMYAKYILLYVHTLPLIQQVPSAYFA